MKTNRAEIKKELAGYEYLEKELTKLADRIQRKVTDQKVKADVRAKKLLEYKTEDEIQEAYGYGEITDQERYELLEKLEGAEVKVGAVTRYEIALSELRWYIQKTKSLKWEFEWQLLSDEEKAKRTAEREALQARIDEKKGVRT